MKSIKISSLIFSLLGLVAICVSLFATMPISISSADTYDIGSSTLTVKVLDENGEGLPRQTRDLSDGSTVHSYNWQDAKAYELSFNMDSSKINADSEGKYHYNIRIEYANEYASDMKIFSENPEVKTVYFYEQRQTVNNLNIDKLTIDVASLRTTITNQIAASSSQNGSNSQNNNTIKECSGWGVYRFSIVFYYTENQTGNVYSSYVGLNPSALQGDPTIDAEFIPSQTGIIGAWRCFLTNDDIEYIDQNTIRWYVSGVTADGKNYVLTTEDLANKKGYKNIWDAAYVRNGTEFIFDSRNLSGTWTIYCKVFSHDTPPEKFNDDNVGTESNKLTLETGNKLSPSTIIWWILGGVAVVVILVVVIIVVSKKKEKVW